MTLRRRAVESLNDTKSLKNDRGVVINREGGVSERLTHFVAVPESLMTDPPLGNGSKPFTFISGVRIVDIAQPDDADACGLNNRHRPVT